MIDTIRVESPSINNDVYQNLKDISVEKLQIDNATGNIHYCFTNCELDGSFDYRIMLSIKNERWKRFYSASACKFVTELLPSKPYLVIEFSIHKFFVGHNLKYGFNDLPSKFKLFISFLENTLNVNLPNYADWSLTRLDFALTFKIKNVDDYFKYLKNCSYPRRKTFSYDTSMMWVGSTTTVRVYSKEHEFKKHDLNRLKNNMNFDIIDLVNTSKNMIRAEVQIRKKKLIDLNGGSIMTINDYDYNKIIKLYDDEIFKIYRNKENNIKYNKADDVMSILLKNFTKNKANTLFAFYTQMQIFDESKVKESVSRASFYRNRKELIDLGIDLKKSDIKVINEDFINFIPDSSSKYLVS